MAYLLKKDIKGKEYYYLVKNIRIDNKWKKFTVYLGSNLNKSQLIEKKKSYSKLLEQRSKEYIKKVDILLNIISDKDLKFLEIAKQKYKNFSKQSLAVREKYYEWFVTTFTYNSNAIEGSTISLEETSLILFDKITPPNRTLREVREVENHKKAFDYMLAYKGDVNKKFVLRLHRILTKDILREDESGKFRKVQVFVRGEEQIPPKPELVPIEFNKLIKWYNKNKKKYHPIIVASYLHSAFEGIHPFVDFNGRTGRLLLNFILLKNELPAIDIRNKDRAEYYKNIKYAIKEANLKPFVNLVINYIKEIVDKF